MMDLGFKYINGNTSVDMQALYDDACVSGQQMDEIINIAVKKQIAIENAEVMLRLSDSGHSVVVAELLGDISIETLRISCEGSTIKENSTAIGALVSAYLESSKRIYGILDEFDKKFKTAKIDDSRLAKVRSLCLPEYGKFNQYIDTIKSLRSALEKISESSTKADYEKIADLLKALGYRVKWYDAGSILNTPTRDVQWRQKFFPIGKTAGSLGWDGAKLKAASSKLRSIMDIREKTWPSAWEKSDLDTKTAKQTFGWRNRLFFRGALMALYQMTGEIGRGVGKLMANAKEQEK